MEMNSADECKDEPNANRPKMETEESTSSKPVAKDPFLSLPEDVLVKIIGYTTMAQWPSLELVDTNFRAATLIAYRQIRNINVGQEFVIKKPDEDEDESTSFRKSIKSILQKLVEHSPFLTSLNGIDRLKTNDEVLNPDIGQLLAQFKYLQSITIGDAKSYSSYQRWGMQLEDVIEFLKLTRSRTNLKELRLYDIDRRSTSNGNGDNPTSNLPTVQDQFGKSFAVNGRDIYLPLKLEKLSLPNLHGDIRLDTIDTTRLTDVRVGRVPIPPDQLTNLIERASCLCRIELSFKRCSYRECTGQRLQGNKKLLAALGAHEKLSAIKFHDLEKDDQCMNFGFEFIEMLKMIGTRGNLRKLALNFEPPPHIDMNEICATIRAYITNLQSIKLNWKGLSEESLLNIVSLADLEEIIIWNGADGSWGGNQHLNNRMTANAINKIAQLPYLKRLDFDRINDEDANSLGCLADAPALVDLRIRHANWTSTDIFEKWANGFASNLEILMLGEVRDEIGLVQILKKATRLRVLILEGIITDRSLTAIARSCPKLEILTVRLDWKEMTVGHLQEIGDRYPQLKPLPVQLVFDEIAVLHLQEVINCCPRLKKLGGFYHGFDHNNAETRKKLRFPKYRKIGDVEMNEWKYDFDDDE